MRRVRGYFALYLSATVFALCSLFVKYAAERFGGTFVSAARFAVGAILCLAVLFAFRRGYRPKMPGLLFLRGLFGAASMAASYAAITLTGPGRATVLSNTYPLFVVVFGSLFFGERFRPRTLGSIALCLAGAALVARDGSGANAAGDALALLSALLAGLAINVVKRISAHENPFAVYLSPCLLGLPLFFFASPGTNLAKAAGDPAGLALLLAVGVLAAVAQALMVYGYREAPAGSGSVVFYWETALTVALGALFAGEEPNARFIAGLAAILIGLRADRGFGTPQKQRPPAI
jgi:drug/metabolite transporter (DMT)-like permease